MRVIWLGQAGLLFDIDGFLIMIDPYLSDRIGSLEGRHRRVPVETQFLKMRPDALICTHRHADHLDPDTLKHYLTGDKRVRVLAPWGSWEQLRRMGGGHDFILFNRQTEVTLAEKILVKAVYAEHSDPAAIGVILEADGKRFYVTGDTLYNEKIFSELQGRLDAVFLPINGEGNNMNMRDAARFSRRIGARAVVPLHWGLLDDLDPTEFACPGRIIPEIYREIPLDGETGQTGG